MWVLVPCVNGSGDVMACLLDKLQVAKLLNISSRSVDRMRQAGQLKAVVVCSRIRFRPEDVETFVATHVEAQLS